MSGLCGWFSAAAPALPVEQMAAPIARLERTPLRTGAHARGALAVCGSIDSASLVDDGGLLVAVWGAEAEDVARLWRSHGALACAALAGQFALAILDEHAGEALLAVDRFASRPLYYQLAGETLVFASSQDAMLRHPLTGKRVDPAALHHYLTLQANPAGFYDGQKRLGAGQYLHLRAGGLARRHYWRMRFDDARNAAPAREEVAAVLAAGIDNAQGHQRGGVLLGGGAASAAIAARLQQQSGAQVATFAVGYAAPGADPLQAPRQAASLLRSDHHEQLLGPADVVEAIGKLAALCDQPCVDPSAVRFYHGALLARSRGTLRLMSGHGLAEQFGHGPLQARHAQLARYTWLPAMLRQLVLEPLLWRGAAGPVIEDALRDAPARIEHASGVARRRLDAVLLAQTDPDAPFAQLRQWWWEAGTVSDANRTISLDLRHSLGAVRLPAVAHGCALAGVDIVFPYLDDAVAACAAQLDPACKRPGRRSVLARALRALAPPGLVTMAAHDAMPFAAWLRSDAVLRELVFDSIAALRRRHIVGTSCIDTVLSTALDAPPPGWEALAWQLMMLEQWLVHRPARPGTANPAAPRTVVAAAARGAATAAAG